MEGKDGYSYWRESQIPAQNLSFKGRDFYFIRALPCFNPICQIDNSVTSIRTLRAVRVNPLSLSLATKGTNREIVRHMVFSIHVLKCSPPACTHLYFKGISGRGGIFKNWKLFWNAFFFLGSLVHSFIAQLENDPNHIQNARLSLVVFEVERCYNIRVHYCKIWQLYPKGRLFNSWHTFPWKDGFKKVDHVEIHLSSSPGEWRVGED